MSNSWVQQGLSAAPGTVRWTKRTAMGCGNGVGAIRASQGQVAAGLGCTGHLTTRLQGRRAGMGRVQVRCWACRDAAAREGRTEPVWLGRASMA